MKKTSYLEGESPNPLPKFIGIALVLVITFALGWETGIKNYKANSFTGVNSGNQSQDIKEAVDMQLFWDTWSLLNGKYVDPDALNYKEMVYGAIRGMVEALEDPYTTFMTPQENKEFHDSLEGTLEGIGAELTVKKGLLTVVSPLKNSPAKKAGIQPEDVIIKINGELTTDFSLEQAVTRIRGPKGTPVTLTLGREGKDPFDVTIYRSAINIESVTWKMVDGNIAHMELNQFGNHTRDEFSSAISEILQKRPAGLILDLRYNGGGYLEGAVDIVSEFLQDGQVVTVKKRKAEDSEVIYVSGQARVATIPMVVLINKGSASASEIVAGALQDYKRATIIGEASFGKGTVQEVDNLVGGASLRITIAKWFTPKNRGINGTGITPDITVERSPEDFENGDDPQLEKAIEVLKKE